MILLDTNIVLRLSQLDHEHFPAARAAVTQAAKQGHECCLVPQVIYEYWSVATRPIKDNGPDRDADTVKRDIGSLAGRFRLLQDERSIYPKWLDLVHRYDVSGRSTHDCRLVAAMSRRSHFPSAHLQRETLQAFRRDHRHSPRRCRRSHTSQLTHTSHSHHIP